MHYSTGAATGVIGTSGFAGAFNYGIIDLLSGPMPTDANDAQSGTLLARITKASGAWVAGTSTNGLLFDTALGVSSIHSGDVWSGVVLVTGIVGYARLKGNAADANTGSNTTLARVDLTVSAGGGAEVNLSHTDLTVGETVTANSCAITQPRS